MEPFSSTSTNYSSPAPMYLTPYSQEEFGRYRPQQSFHSSLHSIRNKPNMKVWKKPIAPLPPTPPRVYKVDPINFRELVQKLTGASPDFSHQPHQRLQSVAPPPLDIARSSSLSSSSPALFRSDIVISNEAPAPAPAPAHFQLLSSPAKTPLSAFYQELMSEILDGKTKKTSESGMGSSSLELNLASPTSWCSFPLLSPGTLTSLEQVL